MPYGQNGYGNRPSYGGGRSNMPRNSQPRSGAGKTQDAQSQGPILFNDQAGKFLSIGYWGQYMALEIGVLPPGTPMTFENRRQAQTVRQVIGFNDISDLQDIIEEVMDSIKNAGTFTSTGLRCGNSQNAIVEINNGSTIGMPAGIYLVIYKNVDPSGRSNTMEVYPFTSAKVLRSYDPATGGAKEDITKIGQFKRFYRCVKEAAKAFTMATAHSIQHVQNTDRLTLLKTMGAMATSLGVNPNPPAGQAPNTSGGGNRSYGNNRSYGGGNRYGNGGGYGAQSNSVLATPNDDPVDINLSIGDLANVNMDQFKAR